MATNLNLDATHAVAYPSKVLASNGGKHIYNIVLGADVDNGSIVRRGSFVDLDTYEETGASTMTGVVQKKAANGNWYVEITANPDNELFVYMPAFIAEDWTNSMKAEKRFYNAKGDIVKGYELAVGDVVEVSDEGITGEVVAGAAVTIAEKKFHVGA